MTESELLQLAVGGGLFCCVLLMFSLLLVAFDALMRLIRITWLMLTLPFRLMWRLASIRLF